jgi:hypothetical protein
MTSPGLLALRQRCEFDVVERGGVGTVEDALDAQQVPGLEVNVGDGAAGGVVAVGAV